MASVNIQLVTIGLVMSVHWEHGAGTGHIAPTPTSYPVTQVGHDTVPVMCKENEHCQSINVDIHNDAKGINPTLNWGRSRTCTYIHSISFSANRHIILENYRHMASNGAHWARGGQFCDTVSLK